MVKQRRQRNKKDIAFAPELSSSIALTHVLYITNTHKQADKA